MSRFNLSLYSNKQASIGGTGEGMQSFLFADPLSMDATQYFGKERKANVKTSSTERWIGEYGSVRLMYKESGSLVGVLQLVMSGKLFVISNIYVLIERRRKGIATSLIKEAMRIYKNRIQLSQFLTTDGAQFFGIK